MNSYRRGLRSGTLVNLKIFLLEKVKLGRTWSNLVKLGQTWSSVLKTRIIWYGSLQFGTGFMQVLYLGRALRTKETLPDFLEKCRVARHSRVFRVLTGSQLTPGFGASQLGIRA